MNLALPNEALIYERSQRIQMMLSAICIGIGSPAAAFATFFAWEEKIDIFA